MNLPFLHLLLTTTFLLQLAMSGSIGLVDHIWTHDVFLSVLVLVLFRRQRLFFDIALP